MANPRMITIRNKRTGELKQIPSSQFINAEEPPATSGLEGIGNDIANSFSTAPDALSQMISSIIPGMKKVGRYASSNNPVQTLGNIGAGGVESGAALLSSPQILMRYLSQKFPEFGKRMAESGSQVGAGSFNDPTFYEKLMNFEKGHGMEAQSPEEESVRNAGGLLFGGGALKKLPNMMSRSGAITGEAAGRGGDPVHAALLSLIGEKTSQLIGKGINKAAGQSSAANPPPPPPGSPILTANMAPAPNIPSAYTTISNIPKAVFNIGKAIPEGIRKIPELAGETAGNMLESAADYGSKVPMAAPILQPTMGALASYLKHISVAPEEMAQRKLFGDITSSDLPKINERMEAAKRLGLSFLTPGEALLSPFQTAKEANVGKTSSGAKLLYEKGKQRVGSEQKAIDNLLETVYDEKTLSPEKKAAYDQAMTSTVTPEFIQKWRGDPIVEKAIKQIESEAEYKRASRGMAKDSFAYWNLVKRVVGDLETQNPKGVQKTKSDEATKARNEMVDEMDAINPRYETARNIAEREFTRKDLEAVFDKKEMTLNNFWSFLKSDKAFNRVMRKLEPFPDAQQKLKDIRLLSNELIPFDDSIRTAYKLEKTGMTKDRNKLDALKRDLDERYGREHDVAAVNLMTNPDWLKSLSDYLVKKRK